MAPGHLGAYLVPSLFIIRDRVGDGRSDGRGGATGDDFRAEVAAIRERGRRLDAVLGQLKS